MFGTIATVTVLYALASLALVGMQNYADIDTESGFSEAFKSRGWEWAGQLVAVGEIITLPLVVLISFLAQPRLQYAMAVDGLLPSVFAEVDANGNLTKGIWLSGIAMTLIALFIPFNYLDDMISAGVLLSFNLTNSSLVVLRRQDRGNENRCIAYVVAYNVISFIASLLFAYIDLSSAAVAAPVILTVAAAAIAVRIHDCCPEVEDMEAASQFRVPLMPYFPLFGIFLNYFLVAQLAWWGILMILGYLALAAVFYFAYGMGHSVGNRDGWDEILRLSSTLVLDDIQSALFPSDSKDP